MEIRSLLMSNLEDFQSDIITDSKVDSLIKKGLRLFGLSDYTYDSSEGSISPDITGDNYTNLEFYVTLEGMRSIYKYYVSSGVQISDDEGSGNFEKRAENMKNLIDDYIKDNKSIYKKVFPKNLFFRTIDNY